MLGFLSAAGGDPDMHLNVYIQDMLKMGDPTSLVSKVGLVSGLLQRKSALSLYHLPTSYWDTTPQGYQYMQPLKKRGGENTPSPSQSTV